VLTCNSQVAQMLHIDHHMILRPYHSHHSLQKQVRRRMISTKIMISLQQTATDYENLIMTQSHWRFHRSHLQNLYENLIGLIKSTQIRAIQNTSIFTRSITLTRRRSLHMTLICWLNLLIICTVSLDGDSSW
jgi:hypothetical protein